MYVLSHLLPNRYIHLPFSPSIKPPHVLSVPFVLGTSPSLPATLPAAILIATAKALNALSAL